MEPDEMDDVWESDDPATSTLDIVSSDILDEGLDLTILVQPREWEEREADSHAGHTDIGALGLWKVVTHPMAPVLIPAEVIGQMGVEEWERLRDELLEAVDG